MIQKLFNGRTYFGVCEKLVPRSSVEDASNAAVRHRRTVAQHLDADDEIAENGQRAEGVNHFAVRTKPWIQSIHPNDEKWNKNNLKKKSPFRKKMKKMTTKWFQLSTDQSDHQFYNMCVVCFY